jgi:hypothetical protein
LAGRARLKIAGAGSPIGCDEKCICRRFQARVTAFAKIYTGNFIGKLTKKKLNHQPKE